MRTGDSGAGVTQASDLYERIRADILEGRLAPGRKLQIRFLQESYAAGQTPIREALNRLTTDRLVECHDQRGFSVSPVSRDEFTGLNDARCWVEDIALRRSLANATPEWDERLVLACHRMARTPRLSDEATLQENLDWERQHRSFHHTLVEACGAPPLAEFCGQLAERLYRYRQLAMRRSFPRRNVRAEHQAILDAVLDRDADRAVALLTAHYRATADIILEDAALFGKGKEARLGAAQTRKGSKDPLIPLT